MNTLAYIKLNRATGEENTNLLQTLKRRSDKPQRRQFRCSDRGQAEGDHLAAKGNRPSERQARQGTRRADVYHHRH